MKASPTKKQKVAIAATAAAAANTDDDGAGASSSGALAGLTTALEEQEQVKDNGVETWAKYGNNFNSLGKPQP